jgi:hypothetical protein
MGGGIVVVQELIPTLPLSWMFSLQAFTQFVSTPSSQTADLPFVLEEQTAFALSHQHCLDT